MIAPDEIHIPADVQEFGLRHGIPEFASATYRAGWIDAVRHARRAPAPMPTRDEVLSCLLAVPARNYEFDYYGASNAIQALFEPKETP